MQEYHEAGYAMHDGARLPDCSVQPDGQILLWVSSHHSTSSQCRPCLSQASQIQNSQGRCLMMEHT